jgi:HlyD family secretion protein
MKKWIWIILSIVVIIGAGAWINASNQPKGIEVKIDKVQEKEIKAYLSTTGDILSKNKQLYFGEQGIVDDIDVEVGDTVKEDDVLMTIKTSYGTKKLRTDIDGIVTELNVSEGQMNSLAQPVIVVQDTKDLQVKIQLSKYDAPTVKVNQIVNITYNDKVYKGKIASIDPTADKNSNQSMSANSSEVYQNAYIDIENPEGLVIGFNVDVDILTAQNEKTLVVPIEAVISDNNGTDFVYVVKNGKTSKKSINLGIISDIEAEIKSGLTKGEELILNPGTDITNGVDVIVSPKEENK